MKVGDKVIYSTWFGVACGTIEEIKKNKAKILLFSTHGQKVYIKTKLKRLIKFDY